PGGRSKTPHSSQPSPASAFSGFYISDSRHYTSGSEEVQAAAAAMSEAYFRVESGALGPEENFLSLDDILMSHEKIPVRTETPMPRLGAFFLERSGGPETDHAIPQGSKLELPLWLAKGLFDNKRRILSVELPKIYQQGWRTVFSA
ncbi:unnamed protein product, partial [Gulo gulo]